MAIRKLSATDSRDRNLAGAILVCAYEDAETFAKNHLAGAISLQAFKHLLPALPKDKEIIFYCD